MEPLKVNEYSFKKAEQEDWLEYVNCMDGCAEEHFQLHIEQPPGFLTVTHQYDPIVIVVCMMLYWCIKKVAKKQEKLSLLSLPSLPGLDAPEVWARRPVLQINRYRNEQGSVGFLFCSLAERANYRSDRSMYGWMMMGSRLPMLVSVILA
jgi:hypothetical protein